MRFGLPLSAVADIQTAMTNQDPASPAGRTMAAMMALSERCTFGS
ncbi:MAG: hypothetical protein AAF582_11810 [Pseudomonadota bacterium]